MSPRKVLSTVLLVFSTILPLSAQSLTPEQEVAALIDVTRKGDWDAAATMMHPDALTQFKDAMRDALLSSSGGEVGSQLFGVKTVDAYDQMTPARLYREFLGRVYSLVPSLNEVMSQATFQVIGSVMEGSELSHVLYRIRLEVNGTEVRRLTVQDVQLYQGQWKTLLATDISELIQRLKNIGK